MSSMINERDMNRHYTVKKKLPPPPGQVPPNIEIEKSALKLIMKRGLVLNGLN